VAIVVDSETRLILQGVTGREGSFHAARNKEYGVRVGTNPTEVAQLVAEAVAARA
jgi:succinyl-CoA synthetase alpha subunit